MKKKIKQRFHLRNMHCECCIRLIKLELERAGMELLDASLGEITLAYNSSNYKLKDVVNLIHSLGFELVEDKDSLLVEEIKRTIIELVHHSTYNAMIRNSDFLVGRFNLSYQHLSTIFSKHEHITLEKFIIRQRIDKAMELIQAGELTLSEIAFMMGYSSVQYLYKQFKEVSGISVSEFKKNPAQYRTRFAASKEP